MKEIIIDETELEQKGKRNPNPCHKCSTGFYSISRRHRSIDHDTGHTISKITVNDCHDNCRLFKEWIKREVL